MKKIIPLFILLLLCTSMCFSVLAQDITYVELHGDDLAKRLSINNNYKNTDGELLSAEYKSSTVSGIGGKEAGDKSVHGYIAPLPVNDESFKSRENHKQYMSASTTLYGSEQCKDKYLVLEVNFMPVTASSIGTLCLQPNAGLIISPVITKDDGVINVGSWNHIRFVCDPSTFDEANRLYPYIYVYVNGKLVKQGRPSGKYNTSYSYLPYRIIADLGNAPELEQSIYWDDFKVYTTDAMPQEYSMPALVTDGKASAVSGDTLYIYEDTYVQNLRGANGEKIVVYDTPSFDYILPQGSKLYDGNLVCVNGTSGIVGYYSVKKELRNTAKISKTSDGFNVGANLNGAVLVAAGYDYNGVLTELKISDTDGEQNLIISDNCISAKGFVFKSLSDMSPMTPAATFSANPTIGIWGASITQGQGGATSYPAVVGELSGCNVYNMGIGGETQTTIAARQGGVDIKLTKDIVIPEKGSVNIEFAAYNKDDGEYAGVVTPRNASGNGWNPVTIAGVEGTLSIVVNSDVWPRVLKSATFTRKSEGQAISVPAGTLMSTSGQGVKTDITIFTVSSNGGWTSENTTAKDTQYEGLINLLDRSIANCKYPEKILIVGLTTSNNNAWNKVHAALRAKYGEKFLDIRSYLASEKALADAGITPTETDLSLIATGHIPPSLISNYPDDPVHLNSAGYTRMGSHVYQKLVELGYLVEE